MHTDKPKQDPVPQVLLAETAAAVSGNQPSPTSSSKRNPRNQSAPQPEYHSDPQQDVRPIEQRPPPLYGDEYGRVDLNQDGFNTKAKVASDGRLDIRINQKSRTFSDLVVPTLKNQLGGEKQNLRTESTPAYVPPTLKREGQLPPPPLNIVVHVVGSRGDVQPFIALGKVLKESHGHRVRLATHSTFRSFVEDNGLEFFNIGGDPAELMAFMVKNPGLMPGMDSLKNGDVGRRRKGMYEIMQGCWRSCYEIGDGTGVPANDETLSNRTSLDSGIGMDSGLNERPFVADTIIANPPSFAHIHCAEKLGVPLHLMFTMPWSPTQAFPHPLANIESSNADTSLTNFISYVLVEMMTWQGLGDMINRFREKWLGLEALSLMYAPGIASRLQVPHTYCWSPALIPKPADWGPHVSISGFYFLSLASTFSPDPDLETFLNAGPPPVYIGFGSIVVDDPNGMTKLIFDAVRKTGQRALVSKGWGGFGADVLSVPKDVFMLGNVPHDWLFKRVSCVVHHGGAGTTAAGVALGKPTVIVPFFGDQPFWGAMISRAGAGPKPIPNKELTADSLATAIVDALKPTTLAKAQELGNKISSEQGTTSGARSFHDSLHLDSLRCSLAPSRTAVWRVRRTRLRLSAFAAATLGNEGLLDFSDLKLYRSKEHETENGPLEPFSGGASALLGSICGLMMGAADVPVEVLKALRIKPTENGGQETQSLVDDVNRVEQNSKHDSVSGHKSEKRPTDVTLENEHADEDTKSVKLPDDFEQPPKVTVSTDTNRDSPAPSLSKVSASSSPCPSAMASVFRRSLPHSRSGSPSREPSHERSSNEASLHHRRSSSHITADAAIGAGKGIGRMVGAGMKSPMDFTLALARGFHNAPKLYGDDKVRSADRVTDLQSGLRAAGKEFGYGIYDGVTGLVTQPFDGAKKEGVAGFVKGFGKGVGGLMLKPAAAFWGLPGYTFKGLYKEVQRLFGTSVENYIIAARTTQGFQDWNISSSEERHNVIQSWHACQPDLQKQRDEHRLFRSSAKNHSMTKNTDHTPFQQAIEQQEAPLPPTAASGLPDTKNENDQSFEEAIKASVAATSTGNEYEDQMIERAIRASVQQLQAAPDHATQANALDRAVQASIAEANQGKTEVDSNSQHHHELEQSLKHSLKFVQSGTDRSGDDIDSGIAMEQGDRLVAPNLEVQKKPELESSDSDLQQALKFSQESHLTQLKEREKLDEEEDIVLRYVQRLSAFEEAQKRGDSNALP